MLGNIPMRACNRRQWFLKCPECGNGWVSDVRRDEYYGWEADRGYCPNCSSPGIVIDTEAGRDEAADEAYEQMIEKK
jgi:hypothetical protein